MGYAATRGRVSSRERRAGSPAHRGRAARPGGVPRGAARRADRVARRVARRGARAARAARRRPRPAAGARPTSRVRVDVLLRVVEEAPVRASDAFVDLGSGLGRAAALVHLLTGAEVIAVEVQRALVDDARALATRLRMRRVTCIHGDASRLTPRVAEGTVFFVLSVQWGAPGAGARRPRRCCPHETPTDLLRGPPPAAAPALLEAASSGDLADPPGAPRATPHPEGRDDGVGARRGSAGRGPGLARGGANAPPSQQVLTGLL